MPRKRSKKTENNILLVKFSRWLPLKIARFIRGNSVVQICDICLGRDLQISLFTFLYVEIHVQYERFESKRTQTGYK